MKLLIHESTMDIFRKYTDELEEVQNIYEANKVSVKCNIVRTIVMYLALLNFKTPCKPAFLNKLKY